MSSKRSPVASRKFPASLCSSWRREGHAGQVSGAKVTLSARLELQRPPRKPTAFMSGCRGVSVGVLLGLSSESPPWRPHAVPEQLSPSPPCLCPRFGPRFLRQANPMVMGTPHQFPPASFRQTRLVGLLCARSRAKTTAWGDSHGEASTAAH